MESMVLWLAPIVLISFAISVALGFGNTIMALAIGSHLFPVEELLPVLVPLNVGLGVYFVLRHGGRILWRLVGVQIMPILGVGLCLGLMLFHVLAGNTMKRWYGALVVLLSVYELMRLAGLVRAVGPVGRLARGFWLLVAGVIHGIYASGGPLLVYALGRSELEKAEFRSTMWAIWLPLTSVLMISYLVEGKMGMVTLTRIGWLVPVVVAATALGEWGHDRVNEHSFRIAVFALLFVVGGALVL